MHRFHVPALVLAGTAWAAAGPAAAAQQCFDFSGTVPSQRYTVGDSLNARHATVNFKQYFTNGNPATAEARHAQATPSQIAGGAPPEMGLYLIGVQIVPNQPVQRLRVRVAQSISASGGFANANIEVNGERHESASGFAGMNGRTIGRPAKGRVQITSAMAPHGDGNWQNGTLELQAVQGAIETVTLGGHTWKIDDLCFGT